MIVSRREPAHRRKNRQRVKQQQKQVRQNVIITMILRIIMMAILMIKISIQHNALAPPYEFDDAEITALQQEGGMERSMIEVGMMR